MPRRSRLTLLLATLLLPLALASHGSATAAPSVARPAASKPVWLTSWAEAQKRAKAEKKPVLVNFTGSDWCPYCVKMQREILGTPAFRAWAAENVVLLEVDFPRRTRLPSKQRRHNEELRARYDVQGFPTVLFLEDSGKRLGRSGYAQGGAKRWIAEAERILR